MLVTADQEFVLRRQGGNPFDDKVLSRLVGQEIECEGAVRDYTLFISRWQVI